jgi:hypothetical protein
LSLCRCLPLSSCLTPPPLSPRNHTHKQTQKQKQKTKQSSEEGAACKTGPDCRSFLCLNGRCIGAGNACTATAATRAECKNATFTKASCLPGRYDKILTGLSLREGMAKAPREALCFNATVPGLDVVRCVSVSDGAFARYGLQCQGPEGSVLVRGLNDGEGPAGAAASAAAGRGGAGYAAAVAVAAIVVAALV